VARSIRVLGRHGQSILLGREPAFHLEVHLQLIARLEPDGWINPHVHAYEVGFYLLSGQVLASINGESYRLALTTGLIARIFGGKVTDPMLVEAGYVSHERSSTDKRSVRVGLTPKGNAIRERVDQLYNRQLLSIQEVAGLNAEEFAAFSNIPVLAEIPSISKAKGRRRCL